MKLSAEWVKVGVIGDFTIVSSLEASLSKGFALFGSKRSEKGEGQPKKKERIQNL